MNKNDKTKGTKGDFQVHLREDHERMYKVVEDFVRGLWVAAEETSD